MKRSRPQPGGDPNRFYPHGGPLGKGAKGQQVVYSPQATHIFDPRTDIQKLYGAPSLLWVAGDGNTPTVGPTMTAAGTPTLVGGPYRLPSGDRSSVEMYGHNTCRVGTTSIDPPIGHDFVVALGIQVHRTDLVANDFLFTTRVAGRGLQVYYHSGFSPDRIYTLILGDATGVASTGIPAFGTHNILVMVAKSGATVRSFLNLVEGAAYNFPAGAIGTGAGFSIGGRIDGALSTAGGLSFAVMWSGIGIADHWTAGTDARVKDFTWRSSVANAHMGGASLSRASIASWPDTSGRWHFAGSGLPRAGDEGGVRLESAATNLCYRNANPPDAADITVTGASTPSVVDASVALLAANADAWGDNVYQVVNGTGGVDYVDFSDAVGAVTAHSVQSLCKVIAGAGARIGLWDGAVWTDGAAVTDDWGIRTMAPNLTPANVNQKVTFQLQDGCTLQFIAMQGETGERCTMPIPNHNIGSATIARADEIMNLAVDPSDAAGSLCLSIAPLGWSGAPLAINPLLCAGANDIATVRVNGRLRIDDGTNQAEAPAAGAAIWGDGVVKDCRLSWGAGGIYVRLDGDSDSDSYDGALPAGSLTLGRAGQKYAFSVPRLLIQRNYQEGPCP